MKCTCWNGCSLHPAASRWKGAFPRTFRSPGGPGAAQSPAAVAVWCGRACTELVGTRRGGESDPGTLGNVKLEKNCAEDLSCYGEGKSIALSPCVGTVKGTADGGRNGAIGFASLEEKERSKDCPPVGNTGLSAPAVFCCKWFCRSCKRWGARVNFSLVTLKSVSGHFIPSHPSKSGGTNSCAQRNSGEGTNAQHWVQWPPWSDQLSLDPWSRSRHGPVCRRRPLSVVLNFRKCPEVKSRLLQCPQS